MKATLKVAFTLGAMLEVGDKAPAFDLPALGGERFVHEPGATGPAVVVFWKPACGTCELAAPYLQRLADAYPADGWRLLAVSQDRSERTRDFVDQHGLTFPVLLDDEGWPVSGQYDPEATPTLFLVGEDGTVEAESVGFNKEELNDIARRLAEHLGKPPEAVAKEDDGNPPFKPG